MSDSRRITLFADDNEDQPSADYQWVEAWLKRWEGKARVEHYSTGGCEHIWDVEAPQAAETAREIIERRVGLIEGCARLSSLAYALVPDWRVDADFVVFGALASETDHLPTGPVRQYWSARALAEADAEVMRIERDARDDVERACNSIIVRFEVS